MNRNGWKSARELKATGFSWESFQNRDFSPISLSFSVGKTEYIDYNVRYSGTGA